LNNGGYPISEYVVTYTYDDVTVELPPTLEIA
jgi:hypothetical protein